MESELKFVEAKDDAWTGRIFDDPWEEDVIALRRNAFLEES